jgi:PAS domain S-box-containing protein
LDSVDVGTGKSHFGLGVDGAEDSDGFRMLSELKVQLGALMAQNEGVRRALDSLEEKMVTYRNFYEFSPLGFVSMDARGHLRDVNSWMAKHLGVKRCTLLNSSFRQHVASQDVEKFREHLDLVFRTGAPQSCELVLKRSDMQELRVQIKTAMSLNGDYSDLCMSVVTFISKMNNSMMSNCDSSSCIDEVFDSDSALPLELENKFQILLQQFHAILSDISGTVIIVSPEMKVLWSNIVNDFGINSNMSDSVINYCSDFISNFSGFYEKGVIYDCFKTGEKKSCIVTHDESVLDIRAFPVKENGSVANVLLLVCDVTGKMAIQEDAQYACHLLSLGELAASVAHEINNPVNGIINYGQILVNECDAQSMEHDLGARILKEGERIGRLVKSLLSYAHERRKEKRATLVSVIIDETMALTQAQIRKDGIHLVLDFPTTLPEVTANLQQIQQAFINIISNARYALNEKYPGWHTDKSLVISGEFVTIDGSPYVRVAFLDQGGGISAEKICFLTKPFFSTKPFGKGTGLGLSITQKIIEDHAGHLRFESEEGLFTRVMIDLPVHRHEEGKSK